MSYFVLRQIHPRGKTAVAHEATAAALAAAAAAGRLVRGAYLQSSDPDGHDGMGHEVWTFDLAKAQQFATFSDAMACWMAQSRVRPIRSDGRPNRPMTAYSVQPEKIDE
jgi:hypothetical protein